MRTKQIEMFVLTSVHCVVFFEYLNNNTQKILDKMKMDIGEKKCGWDSGHSKITTAPGYKIALFVIVQDGI